LAFTSALAAACFVKAFGVSFFARPRSEEAEHAKEVGQAMLWGMGILAALTLVFGVLSGSITNLLIKTSFGLKSLSGGMTDSVFSLKGLQISHSWSFVSAPVISIGLVLACLIGVIAVYLVSRKNKIQIRRTWDCGHNLKPNNEITATGFSRSIIMIFQGVLKPTRQTSVEYHDDEMRYFPKRQAVDIGRCDIYEQFLYGPMKIAAHWLSEKAKKIQNGSTHLYVAYIFVTLIILLLLAVK
jgi:hydrogenase-4 component B